MGPASLTGYRVRRRIRYRHLQWRTDRNRETAIHHLDLLAHALEDNDWRCVKTYTPRTIPVRTPLLRAYNANHTVLTLNVLAVPGGGWAYHEAARGRGGFLCHCGGDINQTVHLINHYFRDRPQG
jgi:hypothetical protein